MHINANIHPYTFLRLTIFEFLACLCAYLTFSHTFIFIFCAYLGCLSQSTLFRNVPQSVYVMLTELNMNNFYSINWLLPSLMVIWCLWETLGRSPWRGSLIDVGQVWVERKTNIPDHNLKNVSSSKCCKLLVFGANLIK